MLKSETVLRHRGMALLTTDEASLLFHHPVQVVMFYLKTVPFLVNLGDCRQVFPEATEELLAYFFIFLLFERFAPLSKFQRHVPKTRRT